VRGRVASRNKTSRWFTVLVASKLTRKIVPSVVEGISNFLSTSRLRSRIPAWPTLAPFRYEVLKLSRISWEIPWPQSLISLESSSAHNSSDEKEVSIHFLETKPNVLELFT
jgi:hypothetical protein